MAKVTITLEDKLPPVTEEGAEVEEAGPVGELGVDVQVEFDPEAPAIDGAPDMAACTNAQGLAFVMLTEASQRAREVKTTHLSGEDKHGERKVWTPGP